ncbi:hypothetical protein J7413_17550 [Shimia sp. R10_1]|uniref:hypothetical protein n=1 Tax=Shimia sp. R10_1 TaxID=2821095 RepID=UPI001ADA8C90|nr:hypothetical protein [Shimia sp. R10_1]MBO9475357.1 hypothetical protein [Shimia sp. R10_1]
MKFVTNLFKPAEAKPPAPATSETSMNFDLQEVAPFLTQLGNNARFTFPAALAEEIAHGLQGMAVDETRRWKLTCDFDRQPILMEIEAFMDDIDAPDLTFFGTLDAVAEIQQELEAFAAAKGL